MKKFLIITFLIFALMGQGFSTGLFTCRVGSATSISNVCNTNESAVFYLNKYFSPPNNPLAILSSKVSLSYNSTSYNRAICCKINKQGLGKVEFNSSVLANQSCPSDSKELLYFTNTTNAKIGYPNSPNFNVSHYTNKLCVKIPSTFASLDLEVNQTNLSYAGYSCLFKTDNLQNSVVSSCDANFNGKHQYKYTVWARLWENLASLKCNDDCTSKLDNRVYTACSQKILACKNVPIACNGALLDSWVKYNATTDVKCSAPWNDFRSETFTNQTIQFNSTDKSKCLNVIKKKYSVILNNELVTMDVYVCSN